jgi:hypothetical protein
MPIKPELYLHCGFRIKEFNGTVYAQKTVLTCITKSKKGTYLHPECRINGIYLHAKKKINGFTCILDSDKADEALGGQSVADFMNKPAQC